MTSTENNLGAFLRAYQSLERQRLEVLIKARNHAEAIGRAQQTVFDSIREVYAPRKVLIIPSGVYDAETLELLLEF